MLTQEVKAECLKATTIKHSITHTQAHTCIHMHARNTQAHLTQDTLDPTPQELADPRPWKTTTLEYHRPTTLENNNPGKPPPHDPGKQQPWKTTAPQPWTLENYRARPWTLENHRPTTRALEYHRSGLFIARLCINTTLEYCRVRSGVKPNLRLTSERAISKIKLVAVGIPPKRVQQQFSCHYIKHHLLMFILR